MKIQYVLCSSKCFFMNDRNHELETLQDIKRIMERSSRFISLSGLSGIAAGIFALAGAYVAYDWISEYYINYDDRGSYGGDEFQQLKM